MNSISWPTFKQCLNRVGSMYQTVYEFIENIKNEDGLINTLELNNECYNVFTFFEPTNKLLDFLTLKANECKRKLMIYNYDTMIYISGYGYTPFILDYIKIQGNPDLVICINVNEYGIKLGQKYGCDIIVQSKDMSNNATEILPDLFYIKNNNIIGRSISISDKRKYNVKIAELIPFINEYSQVFTAINNAIRTFYESTHIEIILNSNRTNILVLCADDYTIKSERSKTILNIILDKPKYENTDFYYLGYNISETKDPYIIRGSVNNLKLNGSIYFDIILIEHCPYPVFSNNILNLKNILKNNGLIVSPNFADHMISKVYEEFDRVIETSRYFAFSKKQICVRDL